MARSRMLKPGFFLNEDLAELQPLVRLLFAGLWTIADREGRIEDRPMRIRRAVLPYDNVDTEAALVDLARTRFIVRYEVDGGRFIWIPSFLKHQHPHFKEPASVLPPPPNPRLGRYPNGTEPRAQRPSHDSKAPDISSTHEPTAQGEHVMEQPQSPGPDQGSGAIAWGSSPAESESESESVNGVGVTSPHSPPRGAHRSVSRRRRRNGRSIEPDLRPEWQRKGYPSVDAFVEYLRAFARDEGLTPQQVDEYVERRLQTGGPPS